MQDAYGSKASVPTIVYEADGFEATLLKGTGVSSVALNDHKESEHGPLDVPAHYPEKPVQKCGTPNETDPDMGGIDEEHIDEELEHIFNSLLASDPVHSNLVPTVVTAEVGAKRIRDEGEVGDETIVSGQPTPRARLIPTDGVSLARNSTYNPSSGRLECVYGLSERQWFRLYVRVMKLYMGQGPVG